MKYTFIQKGFLVESTDKNPSYFTKLFSLTDWLKKMLTYLGVQWSDPCCPDSSAGYATVRYNSTSGQLEYSNNGVWTNSTPTAPPTGGTVDDGANTFNFAYSSVSSSNADYEQTLNGGTTVTALSAKPITGITGAKAIGQVGVRVKASGARPASAWLFNTTAFT